VKFSQGQRLFTTVCRLKHAFSLVCRVFAVITTKTMFALFLPYFALFLPYFCSNFALFLHYFCVIFALFLSYFALFCYHTSPE